MPWTLKDIEKLLNAGKIKGYQEKFNSRVGKKSKKAKYGNEKVFWEGMVFDSTKEYKRYRDLLLMQKSGTIGMLQRQVAFKLLVDGESVATYIADHVYIEATTGIKIVEDVKSDITRKLSTYLLKKKLMKACYNIEILEV